MYENFDGLEDPYLPLPSTLRHLGLHYGDELGVQKTLEGIKAHLPTLLTNASLSTLEIVSTYSEVFDEVRNVFPAA